MRAAARYLDAAGAGVCYSQKFHFHQGTAYGCCYTKGCQGAQRLGLGYWEEETERGEMRVLLVCILRLTEAQRCTISKHDTTHLSDVLFWQVTAEEKRPSVV